MLPKCFSTCSRQSMPDYFQAWSDGCLLSYGLSLPCAFDSEIQDLWRFCSEAAWFIRVAAGSSRGDNSSATVWRQKDNRGVLDINTALPSSRLFIWLSCMPAHSKWVHLFGYICMHLPLLRSRNIKRSSLTSWTRQWRMSTYLVVSVYSLAPLTTLCPAGATAQCFMFFYSFHSHPGLAFSMLNSVCKLESTWNDYGLQKRAYVCHIYGSFIVVFEWRRTWVSHVTATGSTCFILPEFVLSWVKAAMLICNKVSMMRACDCQDRLLSTPPWYHSVPLPLRMPKSWGHFPFFVPFDGLS